MTDGSGGGDGSMQDGSTNDGPPVAPTSCTSLPPVCGPSANDNCCTSSAVSGGAYFRSYDVAGDLNSGTMNAPATVSDFPLDKYEVTVRRFRAFVQAGLGTQSSPPAAGSGAHARIAGSGWDATWNTRLAVNAAALQSALSCNATFHTWTDSPGTHEEQPINCLTWYEAMAFCIWDGGYLPTEAEWNYVATGGNEQRAHPWGGLTVDGQHASYFDGTNCVGDGAAGCTVSDLVKVGSKPDGNGRWGHSDLAGNVSEWTLDWIDPYPNPCVDCANLNFSGDRIIRGGNFGQSAFYLRTGNRSSFTPEDRNHGVGVRCARAM